ncbi:hypothetical protein D3C71_218650 [compost metagenome]
MQDKIDVQFQRIEVVATRRVITHFRFWSIVLAGAEHHGLQRGGLFGVLREQQFDVIVSAQADKPGQLRPAEGNAAHARGQVDHAQHLKLAAFDFVHHTVNGLGIDCSHSAFSGAG